MDISSNNGMGTSIAGCKGADWPNWKTITPHPINMQACKHAFGSYPGKPEQCRQLSPGQIPSFDGTLMPSAVDRGDC